MQTHSYVSILISCLRTSSSRNSLLSPKSVNTTWPSLSRRMFSNLMSRYTIPSCTKIQWWKKSKHFYKQGSPRWPILVIFSHHSVLLTQSVLIPKPVKVNTCPDSHHKLWRFSLMLSKGTNHKSQHYGFQLIWKIFVNGDFSLNYKISTILKMFSNVKILIYLKAAL